MHVLQYTVRVVSAEDLMASECSDRLIRLMYISLVENTVECLFLLLYFINPGLHTSRALRRRGNKILYGAA